MKKCLKISFVYAVAAMAGGVFFREFTKYNNFSGVTALGKVHTHLFILGTLIFLISALFCAHFKSLSEQKLFKAFLCVYNIGVPVMRRQWLCAEYFRCWEQSFPKARAVRYRELPE